MFEFLAGKRTHLPWGLTQISKMVGSPPATEIRYGSCDPNALDVYTYPQKLVLVPGAFQISSKEKKKRAFREEHVGLPP